MVSQLAPCPSATSMLRGRPQLPTRSARLSAVKPAAIATPPSRSNFTRSRPATVPSTTPRRASDELSRGVAPLQAATDPASINVLEKALRQRDTEKEAELKKFRVVYDFEKWATHRSTNRYLRHMVGLFSSRIVSGLKWPLLLIGAEATFVCAYEWALANGYLEGFSSIQLHTPIAFNLSSFALSLLLVFRTNTSYSRFDEARKLWGSVVNRSRDITRQAVTFFGPDQRDLVAAFARWQAAFPWALKNHLREEKTWEADLKEILLPEELEMLLKSPHQPNTVLMALSEIAERAYMSGDQRFRMDQNLTQFADNLGACERLLRTPIPVSYTRHTSRFLVTWLALLPFTIYEQAGWATIPSSVVLSFFLLAIEEIGVQIEEPFMILPLEAISTTITTNVRQHVEQMDEVYNMVNGVTSTDERAVSRANGAKAML